MNNTASLYEILGGKPALSAVVDTFYQRILADPLTARFFAETDMDQQRKHFKAFLMLALGGPNTYSGRSMEKAHAGLGITKADFAVVAGHLLQTLVAFGVPQTHINSVVERVAGLENSIAGGH
jgi:hemoglobin